MAEGFVMLPGESLDRMFVVAHSYPLIGQGRETNTTEGVWITWDMPISQLHSLLQRKPERKALFARAQHPGTFRIRCKYDGSAWIQMWGKRRDPQFAAGAYTNEIVSNEVVVEIVENGDP
jgi:hypothetical protein